MLNTAHDPFMRVCEKGYCWVYKNYAKTCNKLFKLNLFMQLIKWYAYKAYISHDRLRCQYDLTWFACMSGSFPTCICNRYLIDAISIKEVKYRTSYSVLKYAEAIISLHVVDKLIIQNCGYRLRTRKLCSIHISLKATYKVRNEIEELFVICGRWTYCTTLYGSCLPLKKVIVRVKLSF